MLLGIPGTYDAMPNAHFATPIACEGVDLNFLGSIGITLKGIPSSHALNFTDAHKACLRQLDNIQFASAFLDDARPTTRPTIVPCCGAPPCEPNVWGDGSKLRANTGHFSTSTFGMWEPHRSARSLCPSELEFMEVAPLPSGISNGTVLAGVLAGRLGSSTRAELAVGLAAMAKPFPVHFASDSRAFCDKANCIISAPDLWPRRPYALQRDGDIWQHFHEGLIARGPN